MSTPEGGTSGVARIQTQPASTRSCAGVDKPAITARTDTTAAKTPPPVNIDSTAPSGSTLPHVASIDGRSANGIMSFTSKTVEAALLSPRQAILPPQPERGRADAPLSEGATDQSPAVVKQPLEGQLEHRDTSLHAGEVQARVLSPLPEAATPQADAPHREASAKETASQPEIHKQV